MDEKNIKNIPDELIVSTRNIIPKKRKVQKKDIDKFVKRVKNYKKGKIEEKAEQKKRGPKPKKTGEKEIKTDKTVKG